MRSYLLIAPMALSLVSCSNSDANSAQTSGDTAQSGAASATATAGGGTATAVASGAGGVAVAEAIGLYDFTYSYPAAAAAVPALKAYLDQDMAHRRAEVARDARDNAAEAAKNGREITNRWDRGFEWSLVTELPRWVSLSQSHGSYDGGAHPNNGYGALLWDKEAGRAVPAMDIFVSKTAFDAAVDRAFNDDINRQRRENREGQIGEGMYAEPVTPSEQSVIFGSSDHQRFNRIGFLINPYVAGPRVEGDYEVTLPVNAAILAAVKPQYRQYFVAQ